MNKKEPVVLNSEVEMSKTLQIRDSTIDFLVFTKQNSQDSIEVRVQDENVWLTQDGISRLFDVDRSVVTKHLKNVFETNELEEISVCAKFAHTAADGKTYNTKFYNLDAIISVGYRVNSIRATQFRQWATNVLRNFAIKGYVLDKQRLENGQIFDEEYFENLLEEIREIRMSERKFYQKITDIYATSDTSALEQDFGFSLVRLCARGCASSLNGMLGIIANHRFLLFSECELFCAFF